MTTTQLQPSQVRVVWLSAILVALCLIAGPKATFAEQVIFTIDPLQSSFSHGGADNTFGAFQAQSSGSLTAPLSGHFLVAFDPLNGTPASLQFIGGHGYYQVASPYTLSPGIGGSGPPATANVGGKTAGGEVTYAIRDLVWDFSSPAIGGSGGVFPATTTSFTVLSGGADGTWPNSSAHSSYVGAQDVLTGGSWTMSESAPGSGDWTLSFSGYYNYSYGGETTGNLTSSGVVVSTAHFGSTNVAPVVPPPVGQTVQVDGLGGAAVTGGISAEFNDLVTAGTLTVQQVTNNTALSQAAVDAAAANGVFAASTAELSATPQIWDVDFTGNLNGGSATLVFNYDPALLPPGFDQTTLGIWHFNHATLPGFWEFGGTVDVVNHTITYTTTSFSEWYLGTTAVPEPSTLALAAVALLGLALAVRRKHVAQGR